MRIILPVQLDLHMPSCAVEAACDDFKLHLEQRALLRVHGSRLRGRDAERAGIQAGQLADQAANAASSGSCNCWRVCIPAIQGYSRDGIDAAKACWQAGTCPTDADGWLCIWAGQDAQHPAGLKHTVGQDTGECC